MSVLQIRLFGGLAITRDGEPLPSISSSTARSLLSYLVTYRDRPHTRDILAGTFWPELPDTTARRRLSQALWNIRRDLDPHSILLVEGDTVQFKPEIPIWIDLEEFSRYYAQSAQDTTQSLEQIELCVENHRGEFLAGYYDDWILTERERLRNMFLAVLRQLIIGYKSQGQYEKALIHANRLINEDPWSEEAHREAMRLYHLLGRNAEARKQYDNLRQVLQEELGIEPSPDTVALAVEIASQLGPRESPWLPVASRSSQAAMLERPDCIPLVGRKTELSMILRQVETAARGVGGMFLVYGEAGVGKTRLLQELARNVQWRGIQTSWGRCYELTGPPAYQPLVEVFRTNLSAFNGTTFGPLWRAELARFLPELATSELPPALKPEGEQHRLLEAIARGFQALSLASPSMVILEDAHWMDPASLSAIRYLLPRLADMRLLLIISARRTELSGLQAEAFSALENTRIPSCLELSRLNLDETSELVRRCLELEQPPANFCARLYAETEGNPFFLTESLRTLLDEGLLYRDETGAWSTPWDESAQGYAKLPLPKGVAQSIERRLERLSAPIRAALNLAAVIGRGVSFDLWLQACDMSESELLAAADELCNRGLLLQGEPGAVNNQSMGEDYYFAHDQIRRVTYDRLAAPRLRSYHRQVAGAIALLAPEKVEALAFHWTGAEVWDKAVDYHQKAGDRAYSVYANTEAVEHFSRALDVLERLPGAPDLGRQYAIRLALEKVYDLQGDRKAQTQELGVLAELAETLNDDRRRAEVALRQARQAELTSDFPPAIKASSLAVRLARKSQDAIIETESHMEWGWALLLQGDHAEARSQFEEALVLARAANNLRLEADGVHGLGTVCLVTGDYSEAKSYFHQVLNISRQVNIRQREASTRANLGYIAKAQGDHAAGKAYNEQALRIHREIGDQRGAALVMENLADLFQAEGDFTRAREYLERALLIQKEIQAQENVGVSLRSLGWLFHQLGDYTKAKEYYEQALAIFNESGIRFYQGQTLAYLSLLSHHQGENQTAREQSLEGLKIAQEIDDRLGQGWLLDSLGHALTSLGQLDQAAEVYQQALVLRQQQDEAHKTTESRSGLARLALIQGRIDAAKEHMEEILQIEINKSLDGTNEPFRIYLTCFRVLEFCQDTRAGEILIAAYQKLHAIRANINDEALERSFLENVAAHREIIEAYHSWQSHRLGTKIQVKLPRVDPPSSQSRRDGDQIEVTWTVSAPEDEIIPGKIQRRHHRLGRLLLEAESQGAAPTYDNLAEALGVARRTIERDVVALRQSHSDLPPTRGKMSP